MRRCARDSFQRRYPHKRLILAVLPYRVHSGQMLFVQITELHPKPVGV